MNSARAGKVMAIASSDSNQTDFFIMAPFSMGTDLFSFSNAELVDA